MRMRKAAAALSCRVRSQPPSSSRPNMRAQPPTRLLLPLAGAELKALQTTDVAGADTLEAWKQLKEEGKVKSSDDMERDAQSSRLGSEGLIATRIDENLPYIDQGYVTDDQPDFMGELGKLGGKLFGGKKEE